MCDTRMLSVNDSARQQGLKQVLPQKLINRAIGDQLETRYCKRITNRHLIWLVVGMGLFAGKSYRQIFRLAAKPGLTIPLRANLTTARKQLSAAVLEQLTKAVVKLFAKSPDERSFAFYKSLRLMGIDGTFLDCPDTNSNREAFGRTSNQTSHGAFPKVRVVSLWKVAMRYGTMLRSQSPEMVRQEIFGMLISHFIVRTLILKGAQEAGVEPMRISFTGTLDILHARLPEAKKSGPMKRLWLRELISEISRDQLPPRVDRINPRKLKKRTNAWPTKHDTDRGPPKPNGPFADQIEISI
ncbi:MAG: transposase domain-containing protein [Planctomycetota bacterium]|nr:transposase domain-containing protein [Planctomycetota bacterium]